MTPEILNQAVRHCRLIIGEESTTTDAKIDQAIEMVKILLGAENIDAIRLKRELQTIYSTQIETFRILVGRERRQPWLNDFKANEQSEWKFWKRYKEYLENKGFAPRIIENLDILTDRILDNMFNPKLNDIVLDKKGLVVGQVQSGKTANYSGLICKRLMPVSTSSSYLLAFTIICVARHKLDLTRVSWDLTLNLNVSMPIMHKTKSEWVVVHFIQI